MIDALEFKRHKAAASLFVALNVLAVLLWVVGIILTTIYFAKTEPSTPVYPRQIGNPGATVAQALNDSFGWIRSVTAAFMLVGYASAGLFSLFCAHVIRYLAAIAEASGKHASAYLDVVSNPIDPLPKQSASRP